MADMQALVRVGTPNKAMSLLGLTQLQDFSLSPDGYGVRLPAVSLVRPAKSVDEGMLLKANSRAILKSCQMRPNKYHFLVTYNPELLNHGIVSCPMMYFYKDLVEAGVSLGFMATSAVDLGALDWVFELRAID